MSRSSAESKPSSAGSDGAATPALARAGDGVVARFERRVAPFAQRFSAAPAVVALRESLPVAFAVVLVLLVVLAAFPLPQRWSAVPLRLRDALPAAFALGSFGMLLVLATRLAARLDYPRVPFIGTALLAFVLALPRPALRALVAFALTRGATGLGPVARTLGASGLFCAIVVALMTAAAFAAGRGRLGTRRGTPAGVVAVLAVSSLLFTLHLSFAQALATALSPLAALGDSFGALAIITAIQMLLWIVGIHGAAMLAPIVLPVYMDLQFQNTAAAHAHEHVPHLVAVSTFLFLFPGGSGATLPLVLMLLRSRVPRLRRFGYATLLPSLLNVNEPVIFGLPVACERTAR